MDANITGLSAREVTERRERGEGGTGAKSITKSRAQIVRENVFTLFNLLNFIIAALLFAVGAYTNMLFLAVILLNIAVGIAQELKAKKLVDELSILNRPGVCVRRGAKDIQIELDEVVKGDLMVLQSGNQICNDAVVVEGMLEVNESLLTGESEAVVKEAGSELYSGSSVISGKAYAKVTHVGNENYATKLANEVKKEKRVASELLGSMNKVTRFTSMLIVPLGVILFFEAFLLRQAPMRDAVVSSAAALLGMLPKGLVLLISISLATGVIRLAKMKILVQNIYSLETLAHVDALCLDKTGTITNGKHTVDTVMEIGAGLLGKALPQGEPEKLVQSYLAASDDNNATFQALKEAFGGQAFYTPAHKISFSSKRKWGCISFAGAGSVFVGAPEKLMRKLPGELEQKLEEGCRVIIVGYVPMQWEDEAALPEEIQPLYGVVLEDTIRENTRETLDFFHREGVDVKVISGDHVKTVSMIAKRAGLHRWKDAVDLSTLGEDIDYDLLALREADCSIAVADGSDASRQIAQVVLLDSDFTNLPQVVMEGRKVVNNVTRTASVFFIKTIYSVLVSVICLLANIPFPFIPIQITVLDAAIEGYPSFLTIWESDTRKIRGRFLKTALSNALPFALTVTAMVAVTSIIAPFTVEQRQTVMYFLLIFISMAAVVKSCIPFNGLRTFICITMVIGTFGGLAILPSLFEISAITAGMGKYLLAGGSLSVVCLLLLLGTRGVLGRKRLSEAEAVR